MTQRRLQGSGSASANIESPEYAAAAQGLLHPYDWEFADLAGTNATSLERAERAAAAEELLRIYDSGQPFFTKEAMKELKDQVDSLDGAVGAIIHKNLAGDAISILVGGIGKQEKDFIYAGMVKFKQWEAAYRIAETDLAKNGIHITGSESIDLDKISEPALRQIYELVVEELPVSRQGIRRVPKITYHTINQLYFDVRHRASFDNSKGFLPVRLSSIRNIAPLIENDRIEWLYDTLQAFSSQWSASDLFSDIRILLATCRIPRVRKIVCFEHLDFENEVDAVKLMQQLSFALALRRFLLQRHRDITEIPCVMQDERYAHSLAWPPALARLDATAVVDPQGFLKLDADTAVIAFNPNMPVRQVTADICRPAMMVWRGRCNPLAPTEDYLKREQPDDLDPSSPRVAKMLEEDYLGLPFPTYDGGLTPRRTLGIYLRHED